jgi:hypothetical protein
MGHTSTRSNSLLEEVCPILIRGTHSKGALFVVFVRII